MSGHVAGEPRSSYRFESRPLGLWHSLVAVWMRSLGNRSVLEPSDAGKFHRRAAALPAYPLTADLAGVLAAERQERLYHHPGG